MPPHSKACGAEKMKRAASSDPRQVLMFGEVMSNGLGGFTVIPKKPVAEVDTKAAARMLGMNKATLNRLVDDPEAARILKWRWISEKRSKRLWDVDSLLAFRKATMDPEFGAEKP